MLVFTTVIGALFCLGLFFLHDHESASKLTIRFSRDVGSEDVFGNRLDFLSMINEMDGVIGNEDFFDEMVRQYPDIDENYFLTQDWERTIVWRISPGKNDLHLTIYHEDQTQGALIANAVAMLVKDQMDEGWIVTVSEEVETSIMSARPNVLVFVFCGAMYGFLFGVSFVVIEKGTKKRRHEIT